jgi:putative tryptophan/tyrosine transport system substrate-binding protein
MQGSNMRRREFIAGLGSAAALPRAALAQQNEQMRRVGALMGWNQTDPEANAYFTSFTQRLSELGWSEGRNLRVDARWEAESVDRKQRFAAELVGLQPDVILSANTPETAALQQATRTIPIVFATVSDPVGSGFVASLSHPGGNLTGFMFQEASMAGKWLELLTEIAPGVKRVALMFNPETAPYIRSYYLPAFEAAAQLLKVAPIVAPVHNGGEIEKVMISLGREPDGGLIGGPDTFIQIHRAPILSLAAQYRIPAVYGPPILVKEGGLVSYGPDLKDQFRRAADYVDRILRGARPGDLPVQLPTKFVVAINLKTAKALGLSVPMSALLRANEVIE